MQHLFWYLVVGSCAAWATPIAVFSGNWIYSKVTGTEIKGELYRTELTRRGFWVLALGWVLQMIALIIACNT